MIIIILNKNKFKKNNNTKFYPENLYNKKNKMIILIKISKN